MKNQFLGLLLLMLTVTTFAQSRGSFGAGGLSVGSVMYPSYATRLLTVSNINLTYPAWQDVTLNYGYSVTGPSAPSLTASVSNAAISMLTFDNTDQLFAIGQMPHNLAITNANFPNFYIEPHVHWNVDRVIAGSATNITWQLVWQLAPANAYFTTITGTNSITVGVTAGDIGKQMYTSFGYITNNTVGITGIFRCRVMRPASSSNDWSNAHDVYLNCLDIHVPIANNVGFGSRQIGVQ